MKKNLLFIIALIVLCGCHAHTSKHKDAIAMLQLIINASIDTAIAYKYEQMTAVSFIDSPLDLSKPIVVAFDTGIIADEYILSRAAKDFGSSDVFTLDSSFVIDKKELKNIISFNINILALPGAIILDTNFTIIGYILLKGIYFSSLQNEAIVDIESARFDRTRSFRQYIYYLKKENGKWKIITDIIGAMG